MFVGDGKSARDAPLLDTMPTPAESHGNQKQANSAKSVDDTTTGDDTILSLNEELSFLKHDFKASIDSANAARDSKNKQTIAVRAEVVGV